MSGSPESGLPEESGTALRRLLGVLHLLDRFDDVFDIGAAGYVPKPDPKAYALFLEAHKVKPVDAAMFEDMPQNLAMPHAFGMVTVLVEARNFDHPAQRGMKDWQAPPEHVHHVTDDLTGFLGEVTGIHWPEDGADENGAD